MPTPHDTHWFIRARLKTRQLLLLLAIEDEGNIHRAAQVLNISQPAASKLLKELEDALGVPLFERLPRGMRATWYGEAMLRHARRALASLAQARDEVEALKSGRFGQVSVGAITWPRTDAAARGGGAGQAAARQPARAAGHRDQRVLLERLAQGRLDIVVGRLFERHDKTDVRYEELVEEPASAVARPGHPLLAAPRLTLRDLAGAGWIVPPSGSVLRHRFDLMFQEEGLQAPTDLIETTALLFLTRMLQHSDMLAVLATDVARYYARTAWCRRCRWTCRARWTPSGSSPAPTARRRPPPRS